MGSHFRWENDSPLEKKLGLERSEKTPPPSGQSLPQSAHTGPNVRLQYVGWVHVCPKMGQEAGGKAKQAGPMPGKERRPSLAHLAGLLVPQLQLQPILHLHGTTAPSGSSATPPTSPAATAKPCAPTLPRLIYHQGAKGNTIGRVEVTKCRWGGEQKGRGGGKIKTAIRPLVAGIRHCAAPPSAALAR